MLTEPFTRGCMQVVERAHMFGGRAPVGQQPDVDLADDLAALLDVGLDRLLLVGRPRRAGDTPSLAPRPYTACRVIAVYHLRWSQ